MLVVKTTGLCEALQAGVGVVHEGRSARWEVSSDGGLCCTRITARGNLRGVAFVHRSCLTVLVVFFVRYYRRLLG